MLNIVSKIVEEDNIFSIRFPREHVLMTVQYAVTAAFSALCNVTYIKNIILAIKRTLCVEIYKNELGKINENVHRNIDIRTKKIFPP